MNNIEYLIDRLKMAVQPEILRMAFTPAHQYQNGFIANTITVGIDSVIRARLIDNILRPDLNIVSGQVAIIDLSSVPVEYVTMGMVYKIGLGPTGGKRIMSVLSVGYGYNALSGGGPSIASALSEPLQTSDARIELIGENVIYVEGYIGVQLAYFRCMLENDKDLNNINKDGLLALSELFNLLAKAYIWRELSIKLRNAVVVEGIDMGKIEGIIDDYKDCYAQYTEMLNKKWRKMSILNDKVAKSRLIRLLIPS